MYKFSKLTLLSNCKDILILHRNFARKTINPGIRRRTQALSQVEKGDPLDGYDIEDLEADFNNLGMSYDDHNREIQALKESEKFRIIRQKYFKEKYPNFLTWADKQQIKYLHNKDPQEWTVEKLSEGFPALPEIIKKVIKANWTKKNDNKVRTHDSSVQLNWSNFKQEKLNLPPDLAGHLRKFTDRALNLNPSDFAIEKKEIALVQGEFSRIITSYEKLKSNNPEKTLEISSGGNPVAKKPLKEMYLSGEIKDSKLVTLSEYQKGLDLTEDAREDFAKIEELSEALDEQKAESGVVKYASSNTVAAFKKSKVDCSHLNYPEKIVIPTGKKRKGYTYKLSDCYYDDDGEFLYRVPGME